jgi:AcrR family transcriptional regulator
MADVRRRRNRSQTEERFIDALCEHLCAEGWAECGVNRVAQRCGSDKVLLYRYFGDLDGLYVATVERRPLLPEPSCLLAEGAQLQSVFRRYTAFLDDHPLTQFLLHNFRPPRNPLAAAFAERFAQLVRDLRPLLGLSSDMEGLIEALLLLPASARLASRLDDRLNLGANGQAPAETSEEMPDHLL